jgi:flagellum-specific peptidoglycan hydrolase FlgJ
MNQNVRDFIVKYYAYAKRTENGFGISAVFILAQAAIESGWGKVAPGNMFFGVKDTDGLNGNEQLLVTSEYLDNPNAKFPAIISVVQVGKKLWKYKVKDWFRKYKTPEECFNDHVQFFFRNKRYAKALEVRGNPYQFATEVAKAGYATAPDYEETLHRVINMILKEL